MAAGVLSDALMAHVGSDSLRYALLALSPGYIWCTWHLWRAGRTISKSLVVADGVGAENDASTAAVLTSTANQFDDRFKPARSEHP